MTKIAIYPGSFNPIHTGHLRLAREVLDMHLADELWMLVSPHNPLKINTELIDEQDRLAMTRLAIADEKGIVASDFEFSLPRPSFTIDTLSAILSKHPGYQFILLIGSDNALVFDQWKDYRSILQLIDVYVYPRTGFPVDDALLRFSEMKRLPTRVYDISSTQLREWIRSGHSTGDWLHPAVLSYIREKGLYR